MIQKPQSHENVPPGFMASCLIKPRGEPVRSLASESPPHAQIEDRVAVFGVPARDTEASEQGGIARRLILAAAFAEDVSDLKVERGARTDSVIDGDVRLRDFLREGRRRGRVGAKR